MKHQLQYRVTVSLEGLSDIYNFAITVSLENDYKVQITRDLRFITNVDSHMCSHLIITDSYSILTWLSERVQWKWFSEERLITLLQCQLVRRVRGRIAFGGLTPAAGNGKWKCGQGWLQAEVVGAVWWITINYNQCEGQSMGCIRVIIMMTKVFFSV